METKIVIVAVAARHEWNLEYYWSTGPLTVLFRSPQP